MNDPSRIAEGERISIRMAAGWDLEGEVLAVEDNGFKVLDAALDDALYIDAADIRHVYKREGPGE